MLLEHDLGSKVQHDVDQNFLTRGKAEFTMLSTSDDLHSKNVKVWDI